MGRGELYFFGKSESHCVRSGIHVPLVYAPHVLACRYIRILFPEEKRLFRFYKRAIDQIRHTIDIRDHHDQSDIELCGGQNA